MRWLPPSPTKLVRARHRGGRVIASAHRRVTRSKDGKRLEQRGERGRIGGRSGRHDVVDGGVDVAVGAGGRAAQAGGPFDLDG